MRPTTAAPDTEFDAAILALAEAMINGDQPARAAARDAALVACGGTIEALIACITANVAPDAARITTPEKPVTHGDDQ